MLRNLALFLKAQKIGIVFGLPIFGNLKKEMMADVEDPKIIKIMDKTFIWTKFLQEDQLGADGKEFLDRLVNYRHKIAGVYARLNGVCKVFC